MYPHERSLVAKLKDQPFALIGINSDPDLAKLKPRLQEEKITWRSFWDQTTSGPIAKAWNVNGWPTLYVLDAQGKIRMKAMGGGEETEKRIDRTIDQLLAESKGAPDAKKKSSGK